MSTIAGQERSEKGRVAPDELLSRLRAAIAKTRVAGDLGVATPTSASGVIHSDPPQAAVPARLREAAFPDCWPGDIDMLARVLNSLYWDIDITNKYLRVTVERGEVTISGEVARSYQKRCAEADIRGVAGVKSVTNEIEVKPTGSHGAGLTFLKPWR